MLLEKQERLNMQNNKGKNRYILKCGGFLQYKWGKSATYLSGGLGLNLEC